MVENKNHISLQVWAFINQDPYIQKDIHRNIINVRALSKYIIKELKINTPIDAVISAVRRYDLVCPKKVFEHSKEIIGHIISISTKNQLISINITKDTENQKLLPKLYSIINYDQGDVLNITHTEESINIFINENKRNQIDNIIPNYRISKVHTNLASINIRVGIDAHKTPGVIALISNDLAINNINIIAFISCAQELLWFVEEKDLLNAYAIINNLWQQNQKKAT